MATQVMTAPAPGETGPPPARRRRRNGRGGNVVLTFALPSLIWYVVFTIGPLIAMFGLAFTSWKGLADPNAHLNGGTNFSRLIHDDRVLTALINSAVHMAVSLPVIMVGGFMLGYFLNLKLPGHRVLRIIMFIPALISLSSLGMLFVAVLGPTGLLNAILDEVGLHNWTTAWLADPDTAMPSLIGITIWSGLGFTSILIAARLSAIEPEIYAAADLDGANHWQKMWTIAFPIAREYFGVLTMLQYLWNLFGSAGLILLLTRGGPGEATSTLSWMVYNLAFRQQQVGYSQMIGLILFALGVVGLVTIRSLFRARY